MEQYLVKINLPGGFISAGDLYEILVVAESAGAKNIRFGNRQQLYFSIDAAHREDMELDMLKAEINYEISADSYPNIVSSYVADTIFNYEGWLREGVYKDILDSFDHQPHLKVNLIDNHQTFVPFFSGNINFIASGTNNYWYLYIRFPKTGKLCCCPSLVYSDDIPTTAKTAEEIILQNQALFYDRKDIDDKQFYKMLLKKSGAAFQPVTEMLRLPDFYLPYYEGFNKYNNKYWLGIYRRNELFSLDFLKEVCLLCLKTRIGQIYTTPWKSIIVKGIEQADRNQWGFILSKYRLNVRHAANELNWQIEDICNEGLALKQQLVREFEEEDLRTYQLCFAIKTQPKTGLTGSIIIKKSENNLYDILYTRDFNPNSKDYITYLQQVPPPKLSTHLIALCTEFFTVQSNSSLPAEVAEEIIPQQCKAAVYQCNHCLTRYDKTYGDCVNEIGKEVDFELLTDYQCPVCEAPKKDFSLIETLA
ncbi:rubredoxin [Mucilaginibacter ginsenosidivorans]|uniref:Rubredoxin domain-containing protein n=1 Tax=Mucilaginibacter ginsenosidivorans TaxID=398053 RepID=A0A5B8UWP5_9SPHI|nr:rubredoxin [Mucilaginibacter ginsenosidivorans]QEC63560.1 rubredoxin domain-containing protein [Mucilaginibacter ginsenosidivorans]